MVETEPAPAQAGTVTWRDSAVYLLRRVLVATVVAVATSVVAVILSFAGNGQATWRLALGVAFVLWSAWVWTRAPKPGRMRKRALWSCATLLVLAWFLTLRPSHTRNWKPEVAVLPSIQIEGDRARITGYRDFNYRSRDGFDARYQEREVDLSRLNSIDLFISYWKDGPMAHTFLSFGFENAGPVCVSIEARPEVGERFGALPGLLKAFELFYVVGTERDLVRLRTNHRNERVYRYRLNVSPADARRLFEVYVAQINRLADKPEFYHLLRNNCTMNIIRNAEIAGRKAPFDGRSILNGRIDRYLYEVGLVERTASFDELRAHAEITKAAQKAGDETFSQEIRAKE